MKAYCSTGRGLNFRTIQVEIPNVRELTPRTARQFASVAFGHSFGVTVATDKVAYRCTKSGVRRLKEK